MKKTPQVSTDEILAAYSPEVCSLVHETCAVLRKMIPKAIEQVGDRPPIIAFGFSDKYADLLFSVIPNKGGVTLGIARGTELPDPSRIMQGSGKVHRHVKIKERQDLRNPALKTLLKAAIARWKESRK